LSSSCSFEAGRCGLDPWCHCWEGWRRWPPCTGCSASLGSLFLTDSRLFTPFLLACLDGSSSLLCPESPAAMRLRSDFFGSWTFAGGDCGW
jgi:hypothetical protein